MIDEGMRNTAFVQSLERGLAVIRAFDSAHPALTLSDVARSTGLTRAAARRFLLTLVELGYMRTDGRLFSLRPRVLELGHAYLSSLGLPEVAQPHMEELVAQVHESSSMAVLDDDEIVCVARIPAPKRIVILLNTVGTRFPAYATAMGRVLLAAQPADWLDRYLASTELHRSTPRAITDPDELREVLAQVRSDGFCFVDQELEEGLRSCAVPVRGADGAVLAAMNISVHYSGSSVEAILRELLPPLRRTGQLIEADLRAYSGTSDIAGSAAPSRFPGSAGR